MQDYLDAMERLLAMGRSHGWLTAAEVVHGLPLDRMTIGGLAEAVAALQAAGIEIREQPRDGRLP